MLWREQVRTFPLGIKCEQRCTGEGVSVDASAATAKPAAAAAGGGGGGIDGATGLPMGERASAAASLAAAAAAALPGGNTSHALSEGDFSSLHADADSGGCPASLLTRTSSAQRPWRAHSMLR